jgi:hypothetical protein
MGRIEIYESRRYPGNKDLFSFAAETFGEMGKVL